MNCPACKSEISVTDSRSSDGYIRRRRRCEDCAMVFTTLELYVDVDDGSVVVPLFQLNALKRLGRLPKGVL